MGDGMTAFISITESQVLTALGDFIVAILPAGVEVVRGQDNLVAEPSGPDFVVMTPTMRNRIETNIDTAADVVFTGNIAGNLLTIANMTAGEAVQVGSPVFGVGVAPNTTIAALGSGTGGVGTYTVAPGNQTVATETLAAGLRSMMQPTRIGIQLDVHGPNSTNNCQIITTAFRDPFGYDFFAAQPADMAPLDADDGRQMPFINGENQYEDRWVIMAYMQANIAISTGQQYADRLALAAVYDVTEEFPVGA